MNSSQASKTTSRSSRTSSQTSNISLANQTSYDSTDSLISNWTKEPQGFNDNPASAPPIKRVRFCDPIAEFVPPPATSKSTSHRRCATLLAVNPHNRRILAPGASPLRVIVIPRKPNARRHIVPSKHAVLTVDITIAGKNLEATVNTGAFHSVITLGCVMELGLTSLVTPAPPGCGARMVDGSMSKHLGVIDHLSFALGSATFGTRFFVGTGNNFNILLGNSFIYPENLCLDFEKLCLRRSVDNTAVENIPLSIRDRREKPRWGKLWPKVANQMDEE